MGDGRTTRHGHDGRSAGHTHDSGDHDASDKLSTEANDNGSHHSGTRSPHKDRASASLPKLEIVDDSPKALINQWVENIRTALIGKPDAEKLLNILETVSENDRKLIEKAYDEKFKPGSLRNELARAFGNSPEFYQITGVLDRKDQVPDYTSHIRVAVARLALAGDPNNANTASQRMAGEKDLLQTIGDLSAAQINDLRKTYQSQYPGHSLDDDILNGHSIDSQTRAALTILLGGRDRMTEDSILKLAQIGLDGKRLDIFQEAFHGQAPNIAKARADFIKADGWARVDAAFPGVERQIARDYAERGAVSLSTLVDGNDHAWRVNKDAIQDAIRSAGADEKRLYARGEQIDTMITKGQHPTMSGDDINAYTFWTKLHKAFEEAGSPREVAVWEAALLARKPAADIAHNLADSHSDGLPFLFHAFAGHDKGELFERAQQLTREQWQDLHDHPDDLAKIEKSLKGYTSDAECAQLMQVLRDKGAAKSYEDSQKISRHGIEQILNDPALSQAEKARAFAHLTDNECKDYRENAGGFQDRLKQLVAAQLSDFGAPEQRQFAMHMLRQIEGGKGANLDAVDKVMLAVVERSDLDERIQLGKLTREKAPPFDATGMISMMEQAAKDDPQLLARLKNPQTADDKAIAKAFDAAIETVVDHARLDRCLVGSTPRDYCYSAGLENAHDRSRHPLRYEDRPIADAFLQTGHFSPDLRRSLTTSLETRLALCPDAASQINELMRADKSERDRVMSLTQDQLAKQIPHCVLSDKSLRPVIENEIKQGQASAADEFRLFVLGAGSAEAVQTKLEAMTAKQRKDAASQYFDKYHSVLSEDILSKCPQTDKSRFRQLLSPSESPGQDVLAARNERAQHYSNADGAMNRLWDCTQVQAQERVNALRQFVQEHSQAIDKLSAEDKKAFLDAVDNYQRAEKAYVASKKDGAEEFVNAAITITAVASVFLTDGVSLPLLAAIGIGGGAYRVGTLQNLEGSDFDRSPENIKKEFFKGTVESVLGFYSPGGKAIPVGEALAPQVARQTLAKLAADGFEQGALRETAAISENLLKNEVAGLARRDIVAGGTRLEKQLDQIAGRMLKDTATKEERQALKQALREEARQEVMQDARQRLLKQAEQQGAKDGFGKKAVDYGKGVLNSAKMGAAINAATEIIATPLGLEDPNTLWERVKGSAVAGAEGAVVFHCLFTGVGAGYHGIKGFIGKDRSGLFAGEGTEVQQADGKITTVAPGSIYHFQAGDRIVEREPGVQSQNPHARTVVFDRPRALHVPFDKDYTNFPNESKGPIPKNDYDIFFDGKRIGSKESSQPASTINIGRQDIVTQANDPLGRLVSEKHGTLEWDKDKKSFVYTDNSENGTFIKRNGTWTFKQLVKGKPYEIHEGDEIRMGSQTGPVLKLQPHAQEVSRDQTNANKPTDVPIHTAGQKVVQGQNGIMRIEENGRVVGAKDAQGITRLYKYDENGELNQIDFSSGEAFKRIGKNQWNITDKTGTRSYAVEIAVESDGSLRFADEQGGRVKRLDGTVEEKGVQPRVKYEPESLSAERASLTTRAESQFPNQLQRQRLQEMIDEFQKRMHQNKNLSPAEAEREIALTLHQVNRLTSADGSAPLSPGKRWKLAEEALYLAAHPEVIDQGQNGTCNVSCDENRMYTRQPSEAVRLLADVATTGRYTTRDGNVIDIGRIPGGISPDQEARNVLSKPFDYLGKTDIKADGDRTWASQIFQVTAVNIKYARMYPGQAQTGVVWSYEKGPGSAKQSENERVVRYYVDKDGKLKSEVEHENSPSVYAGDLKEIYNQIAGDHEDDFVLRAPRGDGELYSDGGIIVPTQKAFEETLVKMQLSHRMPVTLVVNVKNEPFASLMGPEHYNADPNAGWHVINVQSIHYTPDGQMEIEFTNTWGDKSRHLGPRALSSGVLFKAMFGEPGRAYVD